jgi:hypothetical protein
MPKIELKIEDLALDGDNPRIPHADGQPEAMQRVVRDQGMKLVRLAESIVEHGLSPIERFMVLEVNSRPKRYIALEGNRRVATLRLLANPAALTGLTMPSGMRNAMERLAKVFDRSKIEPIDAFEVGSREDGRYWIELRHNGESQGRGVVPWKPIVASRYRKKDPTIQALDLVLEHGGFDEAEKEEISTSLPLSTLQRLIESKEVRAELGLEIVKGKLQSDLPGGEIIKPLRKFVRDIANKTIDSRRFNKTEPMLEYVRSLKKADRPDFTRKVASRPIEGIQKTEFSKAKSQSDKKKRSAPTERRVVVPKTCRLNVTTSRIAEIYQELCTLKLSEARNAIAVLMRVFIELSVDHFLEANGSGPKEKAKSGAEVDKSLEKKLAEVVAMMVKIGVPKRNFDPVVRSLGVKTSPMNANLLHQYVHNRFQTPSPSELTAAWDHAQPLFENIWP